jgi:hypothetical protein
LVGWLPEGLLDKTVINEVYRVIVKRKKEKKPKPKPNTQENGKSQEAKIGLQKPDFVYLSSGGNLLGRLRRNHSFSLDT